MRKRLGSIEKLKQELKRRPKTFDLKDARRILEHEGYQEEAGGNTSGSRVRFENADGVSFVFHKPHPNSELKAYIIRNLADSLEQEGKL